MAALPDSNPVDRGELTEVFASPTESEALVVQGLLESAGIESVIVADIGPQDVLPMGGVVLRVAPEWAERSRELITRSRSVTDAEMADEEDTQSLEPTPNSPGE